MDETLPQTIAEVFARKFPESQNIVTEVNAASL